MRKFLSIQNFKIRWLLLGVNALVVLSPLVALATMRTYDIYLMRQTERQLIAQSVVVGEAFREALRLEQGIPQKLNLDVRPPNKVGQRYTPIEPQIDFGLTIQNSNSQQANPRKNPPTTPPPLLRAGRKMRPLLERAKTFNLTAVRILDRDGCVLGTTGDDELQCLSQDPEIKTARSGRYHAVVRKRAKVSPVPPLGDIRRRGEARVFSALPVFENGEVIAIVRCARTSLSALESLWLNRRGLFFALGASLFLAGLITFLSSHAIASPLKKMTHAAARVAQTGETEALQHLGPLPKEFQVLSQALEHMARQLDAKALYTANYAANISHELKTPITGIQGAAELLAEQWEEMNDEQRNRFLANIKSGAQRLSTLVSNLLKLARIENAPSYKNTEHVDLKLFFEQLAKIYGPPLRLDVVDVPSHFNIDIEQLRSSVTNLIDNAHQHCDKEVKLRAWVHNEKLYIEVRNDGPGIPSAHQAEVFDRFFSTRHEEGGTGLGLSIVMAIAKTRGGSLSFTSKPGNTCFSLVL